MKKKKDKIYDFLPSEEHARYDLWKFFSDEHGLTLTDGQLKDIIQEVKLFLKNNNNEGNLEVFKNDMAAS